FDRYIDADRGGGPLLVLHAQIDALEAATQRAAARVHAQASVVEQLATSDELGLEHRRHRSATTGLVHVRRVGSERRREAVREAADDRAKAGRALSRDRHRVALLGRARSPGWHRRSAG